MNKLHSNFFVGLEYTNKKRQTHKIEKVEKTYIKGHRGVKLYYDSTHYDELRTIQNDVKFLIDGRYIERQTNKTTKGKQTKNSYITIKKYESGILTMYSYLQVIYLAKKDNEWYVLARTDYDEGKVKYKVRNIKDFTFALPHKEVYSKNNIDEFAKEITEKAFSQNLQDKYQGIVFEHISKHRYYKIDDYLHTKPKFKKIKCYFALYQLNECLHCNKGFRWIQLSIAPKRIRDFKTNKGLRYVRKNILG